jgi:hypothetical protein
MSALPISSGCATAGLASEVIGLSASVLNLYVAQKTRETAKATEEKVSRLPPPCWYEPTDWSTPTLRVMTPAEVASERRNQRIHEELCP